MERAGSDGDAADRSDGSWSTRTRARSSATGSSAPASVVFVLAQLLLWGSAIWTLSRPGRRLRTAAELGTLAVLVYLPVTFLAGAFPFHEWGSPAWWAFVLGTLARDGRRHPAR